MNSLHQAAAGIVGYLDRHTIPYMVFGGLATLRWGRPRLTEDVDVKVWVAEPEWGEFLDGLASEFRVIPSSPLEFARSTHVIPIRTGEDVRIDLVLATLPYEREAIDRAVDVDLGGTRVRMCSAEDLVLHKVISDRSRDREDVEAVVIRQGVALDRGYLDPRVAQFSRDLDRPEVLDFYRECLRRAGLPIS